MITIVITKASLKTKGRLLNWCIQVAPNVFITDINKRIADNICNALVKENSIFTIYYRNSCSGGIIKHAFP
jgi:CRISPR-associated endoribonuclease Cas2 subtype I-E